MRIRKHAKISPLVYASSYLNPGTVLQAHFCQLNQSPWDVMDFSPPSSPPPPPPPPHQTIEMDAGDVNESSGDTVSVVERDEAYEPGRKREFSDEENKSDAPLACCKTDGKSWQCRRDAAPGSSMCGHHLSLLKNYSNSVNPSKKSAEKQTAATTLESRRRPRTKKVSSSSSASNPYEFYYYSGFGPRWGKKRGQTLSDYRGNEANDIPRNVDRDHEIAAAATLVESDEDFSYGEEEDEEEEEVQEETGRKRARKPIKARSLKSLM